MYIDQEMVGNQMTLKHTLTQKQIQQIIEVHYKKQEEQLFFCGPVTHRIDCMYPWQQILMEKDWLNLAKLSLISSQVSPTNITIITDKNWLNLTKLNLFENQLGVNGIKLLVKANIPNLQYLDLNLCGICNEAGKYLIKNNWNKMFHLCMDYNLVGIQFFYILFLVNWPLLRQFWAYANENHGIGAISVMSVESIKLVTKTLSVPFTTRNQITKILNTKNKKL